jgi:hypothetical protein
MTDHQFRRWDPIPKSALASVIEATWTSWHWIQEQANKLSQLPFQWPVLTAALLANAMRGLMVLVFLAALYWLAFRVLRQKTERGAEEKALRAGAEAHNSGRLPGNGSQGAGVQVLNHSGR